MKFALNSAKDPIGVGLAAPQAGYSLRIFVIKPTEKSDIQVFINPKITANNSQLTNNELEVGSQKLGVTKLEGCLSLLNIWGDVIRETSISVSYLDENGKSHNRKFTGFISTIIQHEVDHLNGILFPKRVLEQKGKLYKSRKDEKNEDVFEEIEI